MHAVHKILARAAGKDRISAEEMLAAKVDFVFSHDGHTPHVMKFFDEIQQATGIQDLWDSDKVALMLDHNTPPSTEATAAHQKKMRDFAGEHAIRKVFDHRGIQFSVLAESGLILPGMLILATDTHAPFLGAFGTLTWVVNNIEMAVAWATGEIKLQVLPVCRVNLQGNLPEGVMSRDITLLMARRFGVTGFAKRIVEFAGSTVETMNIDGRCTLCNIVWEMSGVSAYIQPDQLLFDYLKNVTDSEIIPLATDDISDCTEVYEEDVSNMEPMVACPPSVVNVKKIPDVARVPIHQAFIGSCTGGGLEDLRMAARVLKGRQVQCPKTLIFPATQKIFQQAIREGLIEIFLEAGAVVCNPGCGPCSGGRHMGTLAAGEVCVSVACRNHPGRMGSEQSEVYLSSPATAAASAVKGCIADPRQFL